MGDDMGTFRVPVEISNPARPADRRVLDSVLVDTGAEFSWFPASVLESLGIERVKVWHFRQADGSNRDALIGAAMARYVETLESLCREAPYNWFNFFDFWATDAATPAAAD